MINITNPDQDPVAGDIIVEDVGGFTITSQYSGPPTDAEIAAEVASEARQWRDGELENTDLASQTPDWPNRDNILLYRAALRSWPADSDNFPTTRPELTT